MLQLGNGDSTEETQVSRAWGRPDLASRSPPVLVMQARVKSGGEKKRTQRMEQKFQTESLTPKSGTEL